MSMVGRKMFGQVDRRLRQVFPHRFVPVIYIGCIVDPYEHSHRAEQVLGGCSLILIGDWGQLPPVMDLPLHHSVQV